MIIMFMRYFCILSDQRVVAVVWYTGSINQSSSFEKLLQVTTFRRRRTLTEGCKTLWSRGAKEHHQCIQCSWTSKRSLNRHQSTIGNHSDHFAMKDSDDSELSWNDWTNGGSLGKAQRYPNIIQLRFNKDVMGQFNKLCLDILDRSHLCRILL